MPNQISKPQFDCVAAPNGARLNAFTVDGIFATALTQLAVTFLRSVGSHNEVIATFLITVMYYAIPLTITGQTIGKMIFGLRVLPNGEDRKLTITEALLRETIGKGISFATGIGLLIIFFRKDRKGFHDLISKTVVVQDAAVAEKNKSFVSNCIKSLAVSTFVTAASLAYIFYSPLIADQIDSRLTAQGIKVKKVSGNLARGFHFEQLNLKAGDELIQIGSLDLKFGDYLKIFTEHTFSLSELRIADSEIKLSKGDATSLIIGIFALPFVTVQPQAKPQDLKFKFDKLAITNLSIENSKLTDLTKSIEIKDFQCRSLALKTDTGDFSWKSFSLHSSAIDLETQSTTLGSGLFKSEYPISAKIFSAPGLKLRKPIDLVISLVLENSKVVQLQVNGFDNKLTLTGSEGNNFQLWATSLQVNDYFESIPFENISLYTSAKLPIELLSASPQTASFKIGSGVFLYTNEQSQNRGLSSALGSKIEAVYTGGDGEYHLKLPPGFLATMILSNEKAELADLRASRVEDILVRLGVKNSFDLATQFKKPSQERIPATN